MEYTYDHAGRMATMKTWTNYPSGTPAVTTWQYDGARGWLAGKFYANATTGAAQTSVGTVYTYKPSGRLLTRTWARGTPQLVTTYGYNGAGDMTTVDYSDSITPDVTYGYDRRGRQTSMVQSGGTTTTRVFNDAGQMIGESYAGGPLNGVSVANVFDGLLRRTNVSINHQLSTLNSYGYGYSPTSGRLQTVTDDLTPGTAHSATYSYLANSPLVSSIVFKQGSTTRMTSTKSYDNLNRLLAITSTPIAQTPNPISYSYAYNSAGQRYQVNVVADGETSQWQYGYDTLGQVTSGKHLLGGVRLAGEHFEYAFDTIGNRKSTKSGGEASFFYPTTLRSSAYTVNALNQYTTRTVPGYVEVIGVASNGAAKVWVNKLEPERHPIFPTHFRKELTVTNTGGPVWLGVTNLAILNQGSNPDIIATNQGNVLVPMTPEAFTYDLDGNQTSDSLWVNTWNAENRRVLIESSVSSGTGVPAVARAREVWTHLPDGRWIERIVSTNNGTDYVPVLTNRYVWDGNVLLAVLNNVNGLELSFMRGLDLSGTMQGAGGVGGLLAVFSPSAINNQPSTHFAASDGNGNVVMLVNAADGTESARYETGPFAEPLRMTGPMAKINPIRFSTQYADDVTGDIKYLYRDFTAAAGRWRSRDSVGEKGGRNIYGFVRNNPVNRLDRLGMIDVEPINVAKWCPDSEVLWSGFWIRPTADEVKKLTLGTGEWDKGFRRGALIVHYKASAKIADCKTDKQALPRSRDLYFVNHFNAKDDGTLAGAALGSPEVDEAGTVIRGTSMYVEPANANFKEMLKKAKGTSATSGRSFGSFQATVELKIVDIDFETAQNGLSPLTGFDPSDIDGHELGGMWNSSGYLGYTANTPPSAWNLTEIASSTIQIGFEWDNCCGKKEWKWRSNVVGHGNTRPGKGAGVESGCIDLNMQPQSGEW